MAGFFSDFFSGSSGKKSANKAAEFSANATNEGYGKFRENVGSGYDKSDAILSGYEAPGKQALGFYRKSLMPGSDADVEEVQSTFQRARNPGLNAFNAARLRANALQANARGGSYSGRRELADSRILAESERDEFDKWKNALAGLGQQGAQFGQARAGQAVDRGRAFGDSYLGQNNQLASIENNRLYGIEAAKNRAHGNIMGVAGTIAGAAFGRGGGGSALKAGNSRVGNLMSGAPTNYGSSWDAWSRSS